jgi:hypothetical protein
MRTGRDLGKIEAQNFKNQNTKKTKPARKNAKNKCKKHQKKHQNTLKEPGVCANIAHVKTSHSPVTAREIPRLNTRPAPFN